MTKIAKQYMDENQAYIAAEIVYALTNDKGRTVQEKNTIRESVKLHMPRL